MASRKRSSSGFAASAVEESEKVLNISLDEFIPEDEELIEVLDSAPPEVSEVLPKVEEKVEVKKLSSITPTEGPGPRFVITEEPPKSTSTSTPTVLPRDRPHPRNIPKFSRTK